MRNSKRIICRAVAAALLVGSKGLIAQENGAERAAGLEEIVVTARFRQENLQRICLPVTQDDEKRVIHRCSRLPAPHLIRGHCAMVSALHRCALLSCFGTADDA